MFERFTEPARRSVVLAQDEARALRHEYIGTEHILLGLLRDEDGLAARVLRSLGVGLEGARAEVVRITGRGSEPTATRPIPFTPRAKRVLELSMREAVSMGHAYIGTEHVLLGLAREGEGVANQVMRGLGSDAERVRGEIGRLLGAEVPAPAPARKWGIWRRH